MCMMQTKELENHPLSNDIKIEPINLSTDENADNFIEKYLLRALPTMVLVDDDNKEINVFRGFTKSADIDNFINSL